MSLTVTPLPTAPGAPDPEAGLGALTTERGNLPLHKLEVDTRVTGLTARTEIVQGFHNPHAEPIEATYIFPLPDRAAVTAMRMTADGRTVEAELKERQEARDTYDAAIAQGQRASIAEAERADVFTMRVGNILPGERVSISLSLTGPLLNEDGEATLRIPLVVAPRYIPGTPLPGPQAGDGTAPDTDAVPDASRITPPVLLPGFPNPVSLRIETVIDPAGLPLTTARSSLHTVTRAENPDGTVALSVRPGERVDRDFILRLAYGEPATVGTALAAEPDRDGEGGTFQLTIVPPAMTAPSRPRDVVVLLDRSGSMSGWKIVAARRASARIIDTLTGADRFAVRCFDHEVESPDRLPAGLAEATDRNRFRAVEYLARADARGGTVLLDPLREAAALLAPGPETGERDRVLILVTDGQVGNEDQILAELAAGLAGVRVHVVGIDQAVNAGFLNRLALTGRGRCELVESEDRLDEATARIHRRISSPVVTGIAWTAEGFTPDPGSLTPGRVPDLFEGAPVVVSGRYHGVLPATARLTLTGTTVTGEAWTAAPTATVATSAAETAGPPPLATSWARARLRDLEDRYATGTGDLTGLEQRIVELSLRHSVLCRFTAFVAVDTRVVTDGGTPRTVVQPVELPAGWEAATPAMPMMPVAMSMPQAAAPDFLSGYGSPPPAPAGGPSGMLFRAESRRGRHAPVPPAPAAPGGFGGGGPVFGAPPPAQQMPAAPDPTPVAPPLAYDPWTGARALLAEELAALASVPADTPEHTRRDLLSDLASRLRALLIGHPADETHRALTGLTEALAACDGPTPPRGEELTALWSRTLQVLTTQAAPTAAPSGPAPPPPPAPQPTARRAFWKRGS
ncbi:inter-alpha-trypsin inhibitor domain-containing protein [Actinorhabdospora filicis]|uniref:Inter-alpha-trypsin inhibitor domain-containing protein n=1 Tax=Actinorhabdospora filicis TaxID=1785913 RepID=A0A9W6W140_9ACTN|nr:VIT domain-containing protein [Actinorhabdospora filicis]GLZ75472.1 inter-alpha-trypsin inhibitor domain-containing protein [Actinorhabdospora filicis]